MKKKVIEVTREEILKDAQMQMEAEARTLSDLAELLTRNTGGLTEETVQEIGGMIECSLAGIADEFISVFPQKKDAAAAQGGRP